MYRFKNFFFKFFYGVVFKFEWLKYNLAPQTFRTTGMISDLGYYSTRPFLWLLLARGKDRREGL